MYSGGTQINTEYYPRHTGPYHSDSPGLGTIPSFEMPFGAANMSYNGMLPSPSRGPFDGLGSPSRDLGLGAFGGHLQDPALQQRATTSHTRHAFPSISAVEESFHRPTTAPITLSQLMPPKRELPFPKATPDPTADHFIEESNRNNTDHMTGSQTTAKPAKTGPKGKTQAKAPRSRPSSSIAKTRPASRQKPTPIPLPSTRALRARDPAASNTTTSNDPPAKTTTTDQSRPPAPDKPTPATSEPPTPDNPTTNPPQPSPPTALNTTLSPAASTPQPPQPPTTIPPHSPTNLTTSQQNLITHLSQILQNFHNPPPPPQAPTPALPPTSTDATQLAAYAAQPEAERLRALEEKVCELVQEEGFVRLVEDVERVWVRIGLGC
ncbi:MAG: hypothetical protein LQ345_004056 [Seirophora villosa]|nr:MAG: hypothetical protein LQ345_004056 [Seirophora villosa]